MVSVTTAAPSNHPRVVAVLDAAVALLGTPDVFVALRGEGVTEFDAVLFGSAPATVTRDLVSAVVDLAWTRLNDGTNGVSGVTAADQDRSCVRYAAVPLHDGAGGLAGLLGALSQRDERDERDERDQRDQRDQRDEPDEPELSGALRPLASLGDVVSSHLASEDEVVIRRAPEGWRVCPAGQSLGEDADGLVSAMALGDLLRHDHDEEPGSRPPRPSRTQGEVERLRVAVAQLEHALSARVTIEQAIGILAERHRVPPREAFELMRKGSRVEGRRVSDIARDVVDTSRGRAEGPSVDITFSDTGS